jgi:hypothetical protein
MLADNLTFAVCVACATVTNFGLSVLNPADNYMRQLIKIEKRLHFAHNEFTFSHNSHSHYQYFSKQP